MNEHIQTIDIKKQLNPQLLDNGTKIKILGIGGAGNNVVAKIAQEINDLDVCILNTDSQQLEAKKVKKKILIGQNLTKGLGAGSKPEVGAAAFKENEEEINEYLKGTDLVFIISGLGGGTGSGITPLIAKIAKDNDILTVVLSIVPFRMESMQRSKNARESLAKIEKVADATIVYSNELVKQHNTNLPVTEGFDKIDTEIIKTITTISDIINIPADINLDFADIKTILQNNGVARVGHGTESGENRAQLAAKAATDCVFVEGTVFGAQQLLVNIVGAKNVSMDEVERAITLVKATVGADENDEKLNILWGFSANPQLSEEITISIIAADFVQNNVLTDQIKTTIEPIINNLKNEQENLLTNPSEPLFTPLIDGTDEDSFIFSNNAVIINEKSSVPILNNQNYETDSTTEINGEIPAFYRGHNEELKND